MNRARNGVGDGGDPAGTTEGEDTYLNATQAAAYLGIGRDTLVRAIHDKRIPGVQLGRIYRIRRSSLLRVHAFMGANDPREGAVAAARDELQTCLSALTRALEHLGKTG